MYIDTHAHLQEDAYSQDFADVVARAEAAGVIPVVLVGEDIADSRHALELVGSDPRLYATAGVHPHRASSWGGDSAADLKLLLDAVKCVSIGEIGLDYHYDFAPRAAQIAAFEEQLQVAAESGSSVVVHCREAYDDVLAILRNAGLAGTGAHPVGVMHCYFGTLEQAHAFLELGYVLGIGGAVTFKNATDLHEVVRTVPLESLVLETDAPYMAPVPHRGKRNEPAHIPLIAARIAELKACTTEQVAAATTATARQLFRL